MEDSIDPLQDVSADREQFADAAESLKLNLKKAHFDFQVPGCFSISLRTTNINYFLLICLKCFHILKLNITKTVILSKQNNG